MSDQQIVNPNCILQNPPVFVSEEQKKIDVNYNNIKSSLM